MGVTYGGYQDWRMPKTLPPRCVASPSLTWQVAVPVGMCCRWPLRPRTRCVLSGRCLWALGWPSPAAPTWLASC